MGGEPVRYLTSLIDSLYYHKNMNSSLRPSESRMLGWYALRWNHITDWYKTSKPLHLNMRRKRDKPLANSSGSPASSAISRNGKLSKGRPMQTVASSQATTPHDKTKATEKIRDAVGASQEVIATATTVFPFTLFPDTISVDRTHVIITRRSFFKIAAIKNIRISDILTVSPSVGPFLGSLKITVIFIDEDSPYMINYLPRREALRLTRIIKGFTLAVEKKTDYSALSNRELEALLDELSQDGTDVQSGN